MISLYIYIYNSLKTGRLLGVRVTPKPQISNYEIQEFPLVFPTGPHSIYLGFKVVPI